MAWVKVPNAGAMGVNKDLSQHELPIHAWTTARNIRFLDGYAYQFLGHGPIYGTPQVIPYHILPVVQGDTRYWLYAGLNKVYSAHLSAGLPVHTNRTRTNGGGVDVDYSAQPNSWTSTVIGGIPIINSGTGVDVPQAWDLGATTRFVDLPDWPAGTYCRSMRSYRNFLIALGITKGSDEYPYMVKWSHPADPGSVPVSWDETDPVYDAGEFDLAEGYDRIVDGLQLRDSFMIYKESSIWRMDYIGGVYIFRAQKVLGSSGAMNRNCIVEVNGYHFVLTGSDAIVHDGQSGTSVLDKQTRRHLFNTIDVSAGEKCFVFKNPFLNEVFVCYPEAGSEHCNRAMVWNYVDRTVSFRDLPDVNHASNGMTDTLLGGLWSQDDDPWNTDLTVWNGPDFIPSSESVVLGSMDGGLYKLDASTSFAGARPTALLERVGLSFGEAQNYKMIRGIRPRITGNPGETVLVTVGSQNDPYEPVSWGPTMAHTIGQTVANDCLVSGRYLALKFESGSAYRWRLDSFDIDLEVEGYW